MYIKFFLVDSLHPTRLLETKKRHQSITPKKNIDRNTN
jgi:hypothetical protein